MDEKSGLNNPSLLYSTLFELIEKGESVAVVSVASVKSSAPYEANTMMIVKGNGDSIGSVGGGDIELYVIKKTQERH